MRRLTPISPFLLTVALLAIPSATPFASSNVNERSEVLATSCEPATRSIILARRGCCSWHGGVCGCAGGIVQCCDGVLSPTCTCRGNLTDESRSLITAVPTGQTPR